MSCNNCTPTGCNPTTNAVDSECQCVPNSSGAAFCDSRFASLPPASQIKLIGSTGECLANFPCGKCGLVFFNENGFAEITSAPVQDLPSLISYLQDAAQPDGLARQDGALIEGIPPTFDHLMVLEQSCSIGPCCDKPEWKKWRGPANTTGYVFWNGTAFEFGGINTAGLVTSAILEKLGEGFIPAFPSSTDPASLSEKTLGYLCPDTDDLYFIQAADCVAKPLNPTTKKGFVVYSETSACDSSIVPQVAQLCEIATPPCESRPLPIKLVGCADDGDVAATLVTEALEEGYCNKVVVSAGGGAPWQNAAIGATFFPGNEGTLHQALATAGSFSKTFSAAAMTAAAGYTLPTDITHAIVHVRAYLRKSISERSRLTVEVSGVGVVEASAYSWDGSNPDENIQTATAIVPVSGGSITLDVNHTNLTSSDYDITVNLAGVLACAELEEDLS